MHISYAASYRTGVMNNFSTLFFRGEHGYAKDDSENWKHIGDSENVARFLIDEEEDTGIYYDE